jgi:Flp pilus assembly protein TadG
MAMFVRTMRALARARRFGRDEKGSTAMEFAIVALPFFTMMLAAIDFGLMRFATSTLENGISEAARQIRTGQVVANGTTAAQFRTIVCDNVSMLLQCDARLGIDVRVFDSFDDVNFPAAVDGNGNLSGAFQYQTGGPGDIVLVRVFYSWPMLTPFFGEAMSNMNGGARLLTASAAFRNEPFGALLP